MKIKTHKSKWAMALGALAFFSFAAAPVPAATLPGAILDSGKEAQTEESTLPRLWWVDPIAPAGTDDGVVANGTFNGTVVE